jgi:hypothetical protein
MAKRHVSGTINDIRFGDFSSYCATFMYNCKLQSFIFKILHPQAELYWPSLLQNIVIVKLCRACTLFSDSAY